MRRTPPRLRQKSGPLSIGLLMLLLAASCSPTQGKLFLLPDPRPILVEVDFLPFLVKGDRPQFPPTRIAVLEPHDTRKPYPLKTGDPLPPTTGNAAALGIYGQNFQEGPVQVNSSRLGAQRKMRSGIPYPPDVPLGIFLLPDLPHLVQNSLAEHFTEAGFTVFKVPSTQAEAATAAGIEPPDYVLASEIKTFSLLALERYREVEVNAHVSSHRISVPVQGPARAEVSLALQLSKWPAGPVVWQGEVSETVYDPPLDDSVFLYGTPGELMTMAMSRTVGSILMTQKLQEVFMSQQAYQAAVPTHSTNRHSCAPVGNPIVGSTQTRYERNECQPHSR